MKDKTNWGEFAIRTLERSPAVRIIRRRMPAKVMRVFSLGWPKPRVHMSDGFAPFMLKEA